MPEIRSRQSGFTYSGSVPFTENKERTKICKGTVDSRYIYQNKSNNACFQHDMAYEGLKDLPRRTASDKILRDKKFYIAKIAKYNG